MSGIVDASWPSWKVSTGGVEVTCRTPERPYLHVHAPRFFDSIHGRLDSSPNVHLHFGEKVRGVWRSKVGRSMTVATEAGTLDVDLVFDSRMPTERSLSSPPGGIRFHQTFAGRVVTCEEPVFDPSTATLMDFFPETPELSFIYVLPFSRHEALVESTSFSGEIVAEEEHLERVSGWMERNVGTSYSVGAKERGDVPMTTQRLAAKVSDGHFMIGAAGGATRPSSGYAFVTILRQAEAMAVAVVQGRSPDVAVVPRKYRLFDSIFLQAMKDSPGLARESFMRMFERVPTPALVRFLSSESTASDDARMITALPRSPFLRAAMRRATARATAPARR